MPLEIVNGIVARYVNYGDNDRILSILTREHGRMDAKARGCRKPTSPLVQAAQPFVYGEFEIFAGKAKNTVNGCDIKESFFSIREDIERFMTGSAMLRLAHDAVQPNQPNERVFLLLYHALSFLAYGQSVPRDLFLCYLIRYLHAVGFCPAITNCANCGRSIISDTQVYFSKNGGAVCADCARGAAVISKTALEAMRRMLVMEDTQMDRVKLPEYLYQEIRNALFGCTEYALEFGREALSVLDKIPSP